MKLSDRGLDLLALDDVTPEEMDVFRREYIAGKGYSLPAFEFWLTHRPSLVKLHRRQMVQTPDSASASTPAVAILAFLHYYTIMGYEDGILYEARLANYFGIQRGALLDTLAVAFVDAGPLGMRYVHAALNEYISEVPDVPTSATCFPSNWTYDNGALASGVDSTRPELTHADRTALEEWNRKVYGSMPKGDVFLLEHRPELLKAKRLRFERAVSTGMPVQMVPYLFLHLSTIRGRAHGIREAAMLGRYLGMEPSQVVDAICWGLVYGGPDAASIADEAVRPILDDW